MSTETNQNETLLLPEGVLESEQTIFSKNQYLGKEGVKRLWERILDKFVIKEAGKGLSSNDYTDEEKEKLASFTGAGFELPNATTEVLGGIKVGAGLAITEDGVLSATGSGGVADSISWGNILDKPEIPDEAADIGAIAISKLGQPNGVAILDDNGMVDMSQLPVMSSIEEGYMSDNIFYNDYDGKEVVPSSNTIYIDIYTDISYRHNGSEYIQITSADIKTITNEEIDNIIGGE
ncbi:MAG: hypothetical protein IJA34_01035 [Lachnospiraceae bacterium]|nr:hypothetical protein [Lachnospiraceae bacterium]